MPRNFKTSLKANVTRNNKSRSIISEARLKKNMGFIVAEDFH